MDIPEKIFIIPYRNREEHKFFFLTYMKIVLEDTPENQYKIYFIHQKDNRPFNRGAMKNIGYLFVKNKYPNHYQDITLIFNDIDIVPYNKNVLDYHTEQGTVKHFYGYKFALGGILAIKAGDFEKINGFPNYWGWGCEDNCLQKRALEFKLNIDRSNFFSKNDHRILHLGDGFIKQIARSTASNMLSDRCVDGWRTIKHLSYTEETMMINVKYFDVPRKAEKEQYENYDAIANKGILRAYRPHSRSLKRLQLL